MARTTEKGNPPQTDPMRLFPVRARPFSIGADGTVVLLLARYGESWFGRFCEKLLGRPHVRLPLDARGSRFWLLCDGSRTLGQICDLLEREFGAEVAPASERGMLFLRQLQASGSLALRDEPLS